MIREVQHTTDFDRIAELPRRRLTQAHADAWAETLTPDVVCKGSKAKLRPWQAALIGEALENDGAWGALGVGHGKTIPSYCLPRLFNAKRPMLIVPATLRDKTWSDFASYQGIWRAPNPMPRLISREELGPDRGWQLLKDLRPDLIIIDESDELSNLQSSAARKLDKYIVERQDEVKVVTMTGTPSRKSIMGYWHLLLWCLRERAPVPFLHSEALLWDSAIGVKPPRFAGQGVGPGPLGETVASARKWFQQRLIETPGVVIVDGDSAGKVPLEIIIRLAKEDRVIDEHFERFLLENENPDGMPVSDPLSRWRIDGQLGCGVFLKMVPPPPEEFRIARRSVCKFIRGAIERSESSERPLTSEAPVLRRHKEHPVVQTWLAIKDKHPYKTEAVWLSTSVIEDVIAWLREEPDEPAIIWCGGVEFASALSTAARLAYFGREGKDSNGRSLHAAPEGETFVASWQANKRGFNLQHWRRHLIVHPPQSAKYLEQIFGRSHRSGQDRLVRVFVLGTSGGILDGFETAINEARFGKDTVSLTQKLLRAKIKRQQPKITKSNRFRWATRRKD